MGMRVGMSMVVIMVVPVVVAILFRRHGFLFFLFLFQPV